MGKRGYPLLLASGETADGDRPSDRSAASARLLHGAVRLGVAEHRAKSSIFLYGGLPGEPAFGPPAFMHREAIMDSPEAPISHHWLDSTHITFGVLTAGLVHRPVQGRGQPLQRARARPASLEHRNGTAGLDGRQTVLESDADAGAAGQLGPFRGAGAARAGRQSTALVGKRHVADEIAPGWKLAGTLAWGRKSRRPSWRAHQGRCLRRRGFAEERSVDCLRAGEIPRTASCSNSSTASTATPSRSARFR